MHSLIPDKIDSAVLLLHGLGADGADLINLGQEWRKALPTTAFFAPDAIEPCDMAPFGYQWFSLREWTMDSIETGLKKARPAVDKIIDDLLQKYQLPPSKFVLGGFSQGTMLALYTGVQRKQPLAGILGYSGGLFVAAENITARPPVLLVHGTQDDVVPFSASQMAARVLQEAGVPVVLHLIEGLGHGIDSACLDLGEKFLQRVLK